MKNNNLHRNEGGMVSIAITIILMIVISITVLSFAQIIRREQREALDNQLSSQAFYAAESGVNAIRNYIKTNTTKFPPGEPLPAKTTCGNDVASKYQLSQEVDTNNDVSFTCVLLDSSPRNLEYSLDPSTPSKVFPIKPDGIADTITLSWTPYATSNILTNCSKAANGSGEQKAAVGADKWNCGYSMLRLDLVPVSNASNNRDDLKNSAFGLFIEPTDYGTTKTISYAGGVITRNATGCNESRCEAKISLSGADGDYYYMRVSTIYGGTKLTVSANSDTGTALALKDAQILVDSTGRARDVLRRIQVRIPLVSQGLHADNAITSTESICKKFVTYNNEDPDAEQVPPGTYKNNIGC